MNDMWTALEEHTHAWRALDRQGLADAVWADYVSVRFGRSGDGRALEFLYPYLMRGDRSLRLHALEVARRVFEGAGPGSLGQLDWFIRNPDPFLRDRAVQVVGAALTGWPVEAILQELRPWLGHPNQFIRRQALTALSRAAVGTSSPEALAVVADAAPACRLGEGERALADARICAGRPVEEVFARLVRPDAGPGWRGIDLAMGILLAGADERWLRRGYAQHFEPRLHRRRRAGDPPWAFDQFIRRSAAEGFARAHAGGGAPALEALMHLTDNACTLHALMGLQEMLFAGADADAGRPALEAWLASDDPMVQRIAAAALGHLLDGTADEAAIERLRALLMARNRAVAAAAIEALGRVGRSSCDAALRQADLDLTGDGETAVAAIAALGRLFEGSGDRAAFGDLRQTADACRMGRRPGRKHSRPLTACIRAVGAVFAGTGSMEPVDFLLDAINLSTAPWNPYRWAAGRGLVMIEFPAATVAAAQDRPWI